jgi:hypothetical protein
MKNNRAHLYNYADGTPFAGKSTTEIFTEISRTNGWLESESVSGIGSSLQQTAEIIEKLPPVLESLQVKIFLDLPCGDFNWMQKVNMNDIHYTGADIVEQLIITNQEKYANEQTTFIQLDLLKDDITDYDMIFCRDCLVHLSFNDIQQAILNIKKSGSKYLMTTTFPEQDINEDISTGGWRPLNLEKAPFHFPKPLQVLNEKCTEMNGVFADKSLAFWEIAKL